MANATATRKVATTPEVQPPPAPDFAAESRINTLEAALRDVDSMANGALDRIQSLVRLTIAHLRSGMGHQVTDTINAIESIRGEAEVAQNEVERYVREAGLEPDAETRNLDALRAMT